MREPTIEELEAELMKRSLSEFIKGGAWSELEPSTPLVWNWHLDVLCAELECQMAGPDTDPSLNPITEQPIVWSQNVVMNVPPGTMKSLLVSVFLPAWMWLRLPGWRSIHTSANQFVVLRDAVKCRSLIAGEWYQKTFKPKWTFSDDQNSKGNFTNTEMGSYLAITVGAKITGGRADGFFIDDPLDANEADSQVARESVLNWLDQAAGNRLNDMSRSTRTLIMQRLHEDDPSGHMLRTMDCRHVVLPMQTDPALPFKYEGDPRKNKGDLLFPQRFPAAVLNAERKRLRGGYDGQMQQYPVAAEGNLYKREWWRFWRPDGVPGLLRPAGCSGPEQSPSQVIPEGFRFDEIAISVDTNFKTKEKKPDADPAAIWVVGRKGANRYLLDRVGGEPLGLKACASEIKRLRGKWPKARRVYIEAKANGDAVIESLMGELTGVIEVPSEISNSGKEGRSSVMEPVVQGGNWFLPEHAPWVDDIVSQFAVFPKGSHDDDVDAGTQLECIWTSDSDLEFARKMGNLRAPR